MKPEFKVYVKDPSKVSSTEKTITKQVISLIKNRFEESSSMSIQEGKVYVGIFFNRAEIPSDFQNVCNNLFYNTVFVNKPSNWQGFEITLKAGLKLINLQNISSLCIVVGDNSFSEEDIFAINKEKSESPQYIAIDPIFSLEDVIMNNDERESILRALTIVSERNLIFEKWGFSNVDRNTKTILCFHGAPGTGKTMCAHAVAKYLNKKILIGSYSQIQSKFVGEGEKNLDAYFKAAQEQDAVLFIDEADTFLSRRLPSSNENSKHYNSMSNELYTLIENFNGCIVFASNHIKDFDPAVISRIIEPIEFKLPNDDARKLIISKMLPKNAPIELSETDYSELVTVTKGFSGRDIRKAMLIFLSSSAYKYKKIKKIEDEQIKLVFDDIYAAFKHVKINKDKLNNSVKGINTSSLIVESTKRNTRLLQVAANALWIDGKIAPAEKRLFEELCDKFGVSIDIQDRANIPSINDICNTVLAKSEKIQMLDVACRMIAVDGIYADEEKQFIFDLANLLGVRQEKIQSLEDFIYLLIEENSRWRSITESWNKSEYDILVEFKKEFSEAASWYRLGLGYINGETLFGVPLQINPQRAKFCFEKAINKGYEKAKESLQILKKYRIESIYD